MGDEEPGEATYDGFGNVVAEAQEHAGAVTGSSPKVQYVRDVAGNHDRLQRVVYPDGRNLWYAYDGIGRVVSEADGTASAAGPALEQYAYLGVGTVVQTTRPQPNLQLTYVGTPSAGDSGDRYVGLTKYGQVADQNWVQNGASVDRYTYAYDGPSLVATRNNPLNTALNQYMEYDPMGRQTVWRVGVGTTAPSVSWKVEANGNKFDGPYPSQDAYDDLDRLKGGESDAPQTVDLHNGQTAALNYDGWNQVTKLHGGDGLSVDRDRTYEYDALGRRVAAVPRDAGGAATGRTDSYYGPGGRVVEERGDGGRVDAQYVWPAAGTNTAPVLRDRDADKVATTTAAGIPQGADAGGTATGLDERVYALADAAGSVTALAGVDGTTVRRFSYDQDGAPETRAADWAVLASVDAAGGGADAYDWRHLWHGGRWEAMDVTRPGGESTPESQAVAGLYAFGGGAGAWYDPKAGRSVQPDPVAYERGRGAYAGGAGLTFDGALDAARRYADGWTPAGRLGRGLNWVGSQLDAAGGRADDGAALGFWGGVFHAAGGFASPVAGLLGLGQTAYRVGQRDGFMAGYSYFQGSLSGTTQMYEAFAGEDVATGDPLNSADRWGRFFGGVSAAAFAAAGAAGLAEAAPNLFGRGAAAEAGAGTEASAGRVGAVDELAGEICDPDVGGCFVAGTAVWSAAGTHGVEAVRPSRRVLTEWTKGDASALLADPYPTAVDPRTWRLVRLRLVKAGGDVVDAELLRPLSWVERNGCRPGAKVLFQVEELGVEGWADVQSVESCPDVEPGPGRVVTGTFSRTAAGLVDLHVAGLARPVGVTDTHRLFSDDRADWVPAGELRAGERLRTMGGAPAVVERVEPRPGAWRVYNLEVEHEHQYFVSKVGVQAHNTGVNCPGNAGDPTGTGELARYGNDVGRLSALREGPISDVHSTLPEYGTRGEKTSGTVVGASGEVYLVGGRGLPGSLLRFLDDAAIQDHVEVHAAAAMKEAGLMEADLYINKPTGPCPGDFGCAAMLDYILLPDQVMRVHWPNDGFHRFVGTHYS